MTTINENELLRFEKMENNDTKVARFDYAWVGISYSGSLIWLLLLTLVLDTYR